MLLNGIVFLPLFSILHVYHHAIIVIACWPGVRWLPGGHGTFFAFLNTLVHIFMYFYYMITAMGPKYQVHKEIGTRQ